MECKDENIIKALNISPGIFNAIVNAPLPTLFSQNDFGMDDYIVASPHAIYEQVEKLQMNELLMEAISNLDYDEQKAIYYHYFDDIKIQDIADKMLCKKSYVKKCIDNGIINLKRNLTHMI